MEKILKIGGKDVKMRASALIPKLYRYKFGRDMIQDMTALTKSYRKVKELPEDATEEEKKEAQLSVMDLTIFENVSYIMAKHGDHTISDSPDEWLDGFEMFSIYEIMPHILELWGMSNRTTSIPKKK